MHGRTAVRGTAGLQLRHSHRSYGRLTRPPARRSRFRFSGTQPGPAAEMTVHDLGFARRLLEGGDIGIGEAYLRGEWETPDLTHFLELFCANHDLIARCSRIARWCGCGRISGTG